MDSFKQTYTEQCQGEVAAFLDFHRGNVIYYFIRNKKNQKRGVLLAARLEESGEVMTGWSLCHKGDKFQKEIGLKKAIDRAENGTSPNVVVPQIVRNTYLNRFADQIDAFFHKDRVLTN